MHKDIRERFKELCELAEVQEDTEKLGKIAKEIDSILDSELMRLKSRLRTVIEDGPLQRCKLKLNILWSIWLFRLDNLLRVNRR